jgi:hypothetical protein
LAKFEIQDQKNPNRIKKQLQGIANAQYEQHGPLGLLDSLDDQGLQKGVLQP